jgi:hypothetical protein
MRFRKKPVEIEAIRFMGMFSLDEMGEAWGPEFQRRCDISNLGVCSIKTLEGDHIASTGDWIIKGVKGEFYPCKPDIFEMTYEEADKV